MLQVRCKSAVQCVSNRRSCRCSNAITLERVTSEFPNSGALLTFAQFLLISLHGLPKFLTSVRGPLGLPLPWLKQRRIPLTPYLVQVALFYAISLLNNAAFAYDIPMPVHIIFRSGGLVISLLMGWVISGRTCVSSFLPTSCPQRPTAADIPSHK